MKFLNVIFKGHSISELIQEVIYVFIGYFFLMISYCTPRNKKNGCLVTKRSLRIILNTSLFICRNSIQKSKRSG